MGIMPWDLDGGGLIKSQCTPRLTIRCEYPDMSSPPTEVSLRLSPRYGIHNTLEAHDGCSSPRKLIQSELHKGG